MTDPRSRSPDCAQVTVDLAALGRNYETMRDKSGMAEAAAVIKADAYGLGMTQIVPKLLAMGCQSFFVALEKEGYAARDLAPDADIYVLNGLPAGA
ncbi:MAG: alanine racemase, partial [Pseudomonadota bacterium]|nr:alanine racemase [Pseudomonadota bacterium]